MSSAPLLIFLREFAHIARTDDYPATLYDRLLKVLVHKVVLLHDAIAFSAYSIGVTTVIKRDHMFGLEGTCQDILELPHGKCRTAHIVELRIVGQKVKIATVIRIGSAMTGKVQHHHVLWPRIGEEGVKRAPDVLHRCIFIE